MLMLIILAILNFLTPHHIDLIEADWLGCDVDVRCADDVCVVRFYCP